ncbi:hypothetical protein [Arthrobacter sp. B6]|uniref:hypothetical protein n=1 Tax=Arthrobacter sp. B6 TaxID=1570137 RepID=UPI001E2DAE6D|nr:hypothetical protein [Arthrobacter sp. B6]
MDAATAKTGFPQGMTGLPDHVVVFVHGMGKALKGGALQEWAQPLMLSLHDLSVHSTGNAEKPALTITSADAVGHAPEAWVKVLKGYNADGTPHYLNVLMTEASWGKDFEPATASATFSWALGTAWKVYTRSVDLLRWNLYPGTRNLSSLRWLGTKFLHAVLPLVAYAVGFILVAAALFLLWLAILLAKVPVLGRWVGSFVSLFADFLGDPTVWKRKPLQAAAMRQRVRDTLRRWNHGLKVPITVVAHSQGAAIAGQLLFQDSENRGKVTNFVTVGSGLDLLGYAQWGGPDGHGPVADWLALPVPDRPRWINVWGKFDFVPAGPIATAAGGRLPLFAEIYNRDDDGDGGPGPEEHPVYNRSALIYDHIVYSRNRIEVIDPLARLIFDPPSQPVAEFGSDPRVLAFPGIENDGRLKPHRVMVKSLGVTRLLAVLTGAIGAPSVLSWLGSMGWARAAVRCGTGEGGQDPWWSSWLCSGATYHWNSPADWLILAMAAAVIAAVVIGLLNGPVWGRFHGRLERRYKASVSLSSVPGSSPGNPWWNVAGYLGSAAALGVVLPILIVRPSWPWLVAYAAGAALWAVCFTKTGIAGLAARVPQGSGAEEPAAEEPAAEEPAAEEPADELAAAEPAGEQPATG